MRWQEEIGLDVLVHGEFERNDMVQYFGEQLAGFAFTQHGWVQSYGSRCVRPPILFGDMSRPKPMTVDWSAYAQSLTEQADEGHADRPGDHPATGRSCATTSRAATPAARSRWRSATRCWTSKQAGVAIIQIDEAALREGLPLRQREWQHYLDWAVECFRLCRRPASRDETQIHTHMCYSEFNDIIAAIGAMDADVISIETSRSKMELLDAFDDYSYPNEIGPGVYDIHSPRVPDVEEMAELLQGARERLADRAALGQSGLRAEDARLGRGAAGAGEHGGGRAAASLNRVSSVGRMLLVVLEIVVPDMVEPRERILGRRHRDALAVAPQQAEAIELGERIVDLEIDVEVEGLLQPCLDAPVELGLRQRVRCWRK